MVSLIENLVSNQSRRRGVDTVGECLSTVEGIIKGVMEKVENGQVPEVLKGVKFVSITF